MSKEKQLCKECEKGFVALSVMTKSVCLSCGNPILNNSSAVDKLCKKCAKRENRCQHCGKSLN